jgi:hypothetical protein
MRTGRSGVELIGTYMGRGSDNSYFMDGPMMN